MKKVFCFDIDNTICRTRGRDYKLAKPNKKVIEIINQLFESGHTIKIFTARYMGRNNENIKKAKKQGYKFTFRQLKKWNLKFHTLIFGKPTFDFLIDDRSIDFNKNFVKKLKKFL
tara:strand:+ start:263 stop:607 length:345 start_codon:yes stop_codon:yes gene_type:complete